MRLSRKGVELIKTFEICRLKAYRCPAGVWTIGFGHTKGVYPGQVIDQDLADKFLVDDVWDFEEVVNLHVKVPLTQGQFDALVSLSYNIGESAFETSTLLRILNRGDYNSAAPEFNRWIHAGRVALAGLVRRRAAEKQRFLE